MKGTLISANNHSLQLNETLDQIYGNAFPFWRAPPRWPTRLPWVSFSGLTSRRRPLPLPATPPWGRSNARCAAATSMARSERRVGCPMQALCSPGGLMFRQGRCANTLRECKSGGGVHDCNWRYDAMLTQSSNIFKVCFLA